MQKRASAEHLGAAHAALMLSALALAFALRSGLPLALYAGLACGAYLLAHRARFSRLADFGLGNTVTALRAGLSVALVLGMPAASGPGAALTAATILALDALDGALARRANKASSFGARFDMETDAFLVLAVSFLVWRAGQVGAYVLACGALRYAYVLALALTARSRAEAPRSRFARSVFVLVLLALAVALWPVHALQRPATIAATLLLSLSFARSLAWSLRAGRAGGPAQWSWPSGSAVAKGASSGNVAHNSSSMTK